MLFDRYQSFCAFKIFMYNFNNNLGQDNNESFIRCWLNLRFN